MGLVGWVKNLANGDVQAEAEGSTDAVDLFIDMIKKGPSAARVIDLKVQDMPATYCDVAFDIRAF